MLCIAICDDDIQLCIELENLLIECNDKFDIDVFFTGEELCRVLETGQTYDLLFLDIELKSLDGISVGKFIRDTLNNNYLQIVYISSKKSYAMDLFEIRPMHFLIKPLDDVKIKAVVCKAMELLDKGNTFFRYQKSNIIFKKMLKEIKYYSSSGRKVLIHTADDECDEIYGKLDDIHKQIGASFIRIHKSYLVNYDHIAKLQYDQVELFNGEVLPISQSRRNQVRALVLKIESGV